MSWNELAIKLHSEYYKLKRKVYVQDHDNDLDDFFSDFYLLSDGMRQVWVDMAKASIFLVLSNLGDSLDDE